MQQSSTEPRLVPSWNWIKCVTCEACLTYLSTTESLSSTYIVFWKFLELHEICCCIACTIWSYVEDNLLQYSNTSMGRFFSSLYRWWNCPYWYQLLNMSCLLPLTTPIKQNFKAFFFPQQKQITWSPLCHLASSCHIGHSLTVLAFGNTLFLTSLYATMLPMGLSPCGVWHQTKCWAHSFFALLSLAANHWLSPFL